MQRLINHNPLIFDSFTSVFLMMGWVTYIILTPYYFFPSGLPQIGDYIMVGISGLTCGFFFLKQKIIFNRVFVLMSMLIGLYTAINVIYFVFLREALFLYGGLYYIYNGFVFMATVILFKNYPDKMITIARLGIFLSIILQITWIMLFDSNSQYRETGSFNNPNQLGYWALLSACFLLLLNHNQRMKWYDLIAFALTFYICTEALSRAVILSYAIVFIAFLSGQYVSFLIKMALACFIGLYALIQITIFDNTAFLINQIPFTEEVLGRILSIQTEENVLGERGYQRIFEYPQYLFFCAGEGGYYRFNTPLEMHSGLGTVLFSYGIFGFTLFAIFIWAIFRKTPITFWITLLAVMAYGVTHQHIRFTGFWVFLGLAYSVSRYVLPIPHQEQGSSHLPRPHHPQSLTTANADRMI